MFCVAKSKIIGSRRISILTRSLQQLDPELYDIIQGEKSRQRNSIVLIPSENFTSLAVFEALGSVLSNKYSEGYPGARYYGGNQFIDMVESACQARALDAFDLDPQLWGVNVQALSGSPANLYVYQALMKPHDRLMGLDLPHGGHLSHGYQTPSKKISAVSTYFSTLGYRVNEKSGLVDFDALKVLASHFRPKILIAGASAYPRNWNYSEMKNIANSCGAYLMSDIAHISGLVAAKVLPSPFEHSDIVTTTTHKSLRGPRGAMIFFRKGVRSVDKKGSQIMYDLEGPINFSVFPGHQGGPHNHTIAALAVALKQVKSQEFVDYQKQVLKNAKALEKRLLSLGYKLVTGGTDTHLLMIDLRDKKIDGARVERVLEMANVATNKNTVPGDKSALIPGGLRVGTPAMTTRGFKEDDFEKVADIIHRGVLIALDVQSKVQSTRLIDFKAFLSDSGKAFPEISELKDNVAKFAGGFPGIGF